MIRNTTLPPPLPTLKALEPLASISSAAVAELSSDRGVSGDVLICTCPVDEEFTEFATTFADHGGLLYQTNPVTQCNRCSSTCMQSGGLLTVPVLPME